MDREETRQGNITGIISNILHGSLLFFIVLNHCRSRFIGEPWAGLPLRAREGICPDDTLIVPEGDMGCLVVGES